MRISKIFHWLYASVMLMPIFAIGVKCLYTTFNPNAKDSYYGETINQYENKLVNNFNDFKIGSKYIFTSNSINSVVNNINAKRIYYSEINIISYSPSQETWYNNMLQAEGFTTTFYDNHSYIAPIVDGVVLSSLDMYSFSCIFEFTLESYTSPGGNYTFTELWDNYISQNIYNDYSYIDNVFYYSVEQINNEPLFSWAQSSFLSQPLLFITNFFGVPSTSPILTILCYWFSISVIWLVFDAVMYFPLLIHRWLDKGVIE